MPFHYSYVLIFFLWLCFITNLWEVGCGKFMLVLFYLLSKLRLFGEINVDVPTKVTIVEKHKLQPKVILTDLCLAVILTISMQPYRTFLT